MATDKPSDVEKDPLKNHMGGDAASAAMVDDSTVMNDDSTVHFVNGKKTSCLDVAIKGSDGQSSEEEFAGLTKEELMKFANDPFWRRVRIVLMVIFAVMWMLMLAAAIAIIVVAPKCPPQPDLDWWQKSIIYHIHPQSFLDAKDNDGWGDIKGIHEKLNYLKNDLHVDTICVGPMNFMGNFEYGYNIVDYNAICPHHFGSMTEFEELLVAMHKKDMKLIMDFVPNHTSLKHKWFIASSKPLSEESTHRDFYIWHPGTGTIDANGRRALPNDWLDIHNNSAWTWHDDRQEYYYHAFSKDEPDLNLTNPAVVAELDESLRHWLRAGVSGFRFYGVQYLVESNLSLPYDIDDSTRPTMFQPQSYELVAHWRQLLHDFSHNDGKSKSRYYPRLMVAEVKGTADKTQRFMQKQGDQDGAQIATNVALTRVNADCDTRCIFNLIRSWMPFADLNDMWSNWQLGSVDTHRVASRMTEPRSVNALNMLLLTLPGTPLVYYGEELGMTDITLTSANCNSIDNAMTMSVVGNLCRYVNRSPMQWNDQQFAGFTAGNLTWMPVSDSYRSVNVETQQAHGSGYSPLSVFSSIAKLRRKPSFQWGKFGPAVLGNVLAYTRQAEGFDGYLVAINFGTESSTVSFTREDSGMSTVPPKGVIVATTGHFEGPGRSKEFEIGKEVPLRSVHLESGEGVIFSWTPEALVA